MEEELFEYRVVELSSAPCFSPQADFNGKHDSLFFNDGVRRIDFVLVYEDEDKKDFDKRHTFQRKKVSHTKPLVPPLAFSFPHVVLSEIDGGQVLLG